MSPHAMTKDNKKRHIACTNMSPQANARSKNICHVAYVSIPAEVHESILHVKNKHYKKNHVKRCGGKTLQEESCGDM